jgi:hypothetical protein
MIMKNVYVTFSHWLVLSAAQKDENIWGKFQLTSIESTYCCAEACYITGVSPFVHPE